MLGNRVHWSVLTVSQVFEEEKFWEEKRVREKNELDTVSDYDSESGIPVELQ